MKRRGRTGTFRFAWLFLFLVLGTQLSGYSQHAIFDVTFDPPSPAELQFGELVHWKLNYRTTAPGGVRIYGYPMTEGGYSGDMWHSGSPLYATGPGSGSGHFTIVSGEKTVDQVRFVMVDDANVALFHTTVAVMYKFSESGAEPGMTLECVCEETIETDYGTFNVCVTVDHRPEENWDCYTYYITNIDYCRDDCGVCGFYVRNAHGHETNYQWGPPGWLLNWPDGDVWQWHAPPSTCGIMPGETRRMGFCVPASTEVDKDQEAAVWGCRWEVAVTGALTPARRCPWKFYTCGPGPRPVDHPRCTYAIEPTSWVAPECGGRTAVQLTTQPGCPWTAQSSAAWLTVSPTSGTGSYIVRVSATSNDTGQTRTGTVTFSGANWTATLTVHQRPCATGCVDAISPTSAHFSARGGTVTVQISTTLRVCPWTAVSPCAWVTVSPTSGSGSGSVTVTVSANRGRTSRTCTLNIAGYSFIVTQEGG